MKKIRIMSVVLVVLLVLPCILTGSALESEQGCYTYAIGSRPFLADTFEELVGASDVMLIGQVIAQYPEIRHDMVFTYSRVQVSKILEGSLVGTSKQIEVLQTGGTANGITSPALTDEPLMNIGENYLLCLTFSPADEQYQAYYLPTGGGQGIISFSDMASAKTTTNQSEVAGTGLAQVISRAEIVFDNGKYGCCQPMGGTYGDEYTNGYWPIANIDFGIFDSISDPENVFAYRASTAILTWNQNNYLTLTENNSTPTPDIFVFANDYGQTTWEAITLYDVGGGDFNDGRGYSDGIYERVKIQVNFGKYEYDDLIWRGIVCHEAGHAIGLGHVNPNDCINSVMVAETPNRRYVVPHQYDIDLVNTMYELIYGE